MLNFLSGLKTAGTMVLLAGSHAAGARPIDNKFVAHPAPSGVPAHLQHYVGDNINFSGSRNLQQYRAATGGGSTAPPTKPAASSQSGGPVVTSQGGGQTPSTQRSTPGTQVNGGNQGSCPRQFDCDGRERGEGHTSG